MTVNDSSCLPARCARAPLWKQLIGHYMHEKALKQEAEEKQLVTCRIVEREKERSKKSWEKRIQCTKENISLVPIPLGPFAHSAVVNRPRPSGWLHTAQSLSPLSLQCDSKEATARKGSRNLLEVS